MTHFGIDFRRLGLSLFSLPAYWREYRQFKANLPSSEAAKFTWKSYPCLMDRHAQSGSGRGHYFHQDLYVAKRVFECNPKVHVDVGSRIDGFVSHVAVFREIEVFDIRPLESDIPNVKFVQADLMSDLPERYTNYADSLSCLHTIEHFGLGRYGDPIEPNGHLIGLANLSRIVAPGGIFYFSTVIGPPRIEFNAHRVFSIAYLLQNLGDDLTLERVSYIDDDGNFHPNVAIDERLDANFDCRFGCVIFELRKG